MHTQRQTLAKTEAPPTMLRTALPITITDFIEQFVEKKPANDGQALALGCAKPQEYLSFCERGYAVQVVDENCEKFRSLISFNQDFWSGVIVPQRCRLEKYLSKAPNASFDAVVAFDVLDQNDDSGQLLFFSVLADIVRILKSGGLFLCSMTKFQESHQVEARRDIASVLARTTTTMLRDAWRPVLRKRYYQPERPYQGPRGLYTHLLCHWDLVARKP